MSIANRYAYGAELVRLAGKDDRIVVVDSDFGTCAGYDAFQAKFPDRYLNCGIAEQGMCSVAAGLAASGMTAFAASFAVFTSMRALDQVRNGAALYDLNVKFIGSHAGIETGPDGATHQSVEDIAIMRAIPHMKVLCPSTPHQTAALTRLMADTPGTFYIRFGRDPNQEYYPEDVKVSLGGSAQLTEGDDAAILAHGRMVEISLSAAKTLEKQGIRVRVIDMYSIKPMDEEAVLRAAKETGALVTAEDHSVIGGLGGAVSEFLAENCPTRLVRVGMRDTYARSGKAAELRAKYGLDEDGVIAAVRKVLN